MRRLRLPAASVSQAAQHPLLLIDSEVNDEVCDARAAFISQACNLVISSCLFSYSSKLFAFNSSTLKKGTKCLP